MRIFHYFIISFLFFSCAEEEISVFLQQDGQTIQSGLSKIHFFDRQNALAIGGNMWTRGICMESTDGGKSWQEDSISNKKLLGLTIHPQEKTIAVGVDGYLFQKDDPGDFWRFERLQYWDILRDVEILTDGKIVCVGGAGLTNGVIYLLDTNFATDTVFRVNQELRGIACPSDNICFAVGLGNVIKLYPQEKKIEHLSVSGDFFTDIEFIDSEKGFILGATGSFYFSEDSGHSWKQLVEASTFSGSGPIYLRCHFVSASRGYRVGDAGLIEFTRDGGRHWIDISTTYKDRINDVFALTDRVFLVSEAGDILSIESIE